MTDARSRSLLIRLLAAVVLAGLQGLAVMPSIGRAYGRIVGFVMVGFVCLVVAVSSAAATTTPVAGALYSYDWAAPNAQRAVESIPRVTRLMDVPAPRDAERPPTRPRPADFVATKAGTAVVPSAPFKLGQWGEARLAAQLGGAGVKPRSPFTTSLGPRYVDRLVNGVAYEAKAGIDVSLTSSIRRQALKDAELVSLGRVQAVEWHFFQGAQPELLGFLRQYGIKPVVQQ